MNPNDRQNKIGIQSPANNSIRLSSYIAALDRYIDLSGFAFPVTDTREGVKYDFDLFNPSDSYLIKVFTQLNEDEFEKYESFHEDDNVLFIFDATDLTDECPDCGKPCFGSINEDFLAIAYEFQALVYLDGQLWHIVEDDDEEEVWETMMPVQRRILLDEINGLN